MDIEYKFFYVFRIHAFCVLWAISKEHMIIIIIILGKDA